MSNGIATPSGCTLEDGSPHDLSLVFHGSENAGWTLGNSGDSCAQRSDEDLDLDLSLRICSPVSEDWVGQITHVQGEAEKSGGVGLCLDLRLDLPEPGSWDSRVEEVGPMPKRQMGLEISTHKGESSTWLSKWTLELRRDGVGGIDGWGHEK